MNGQIKQVLLRSASSSPGPFGDLREFVIPGAADWPAVLELDKGSSWPDDLIEFYLFERYCRLRRPWYTRLPVHYHHLLGGPARAAVSARMAQAALRRLRMGPEDLPGFPGWPIEPAVDAIRWAQGIPADLWPDGRAFALALSHDLDSGAGWERAVRLAQMEENLGLRSCWFIVGHLYPLNYRVLDRLAGAGHEIGLHGYDHRGVLPWLPPEKAAARLATLERFCAQYGICGYRSPSLFRSDALYEALAGRFAYDSSAPDTERLTGMGPANGACTVYPFVRGGVVVLPLTMPQDAWLQFMGLRIDEMLAVWGRKLAWIASLGGLAMVNVHPDPWFGGSGSEVYGRFLELLTAAGVAWHALPRQIAARAGACLRRQAMLSEEDHVPA